MSVASSEALLRVSWSARPRGFGALMALYESNYLRLLQLCGDPAQVDGERVSRVSRGCDLKLAVVEQCAYTTTIGLTHLFGDDDAVGPGVLFGVQKGGDAPCVYCDARLAQAQHWPSDRPEPFGRDPLQSERELEHRWVHNTMLNKWLEYCLELGHSLRS